METGFTQFLLRQAQHLDRRGRRPKLCKKMGKGMEHDGGNFQLGGKFRNLCACSRRNALRSTLVSPFDATENDQGVTHLSDRVIVGFVHLRPAFFGDDATEIVDMKDEKPHAATLACAEKKTQSFVHHALVE